MIELQVGVGEELRYPDLAATEELAGDLREALVDPGVLAAVRVGVDQVLEFVRDEVVVLHAWRRKDVAFDIEHLAFVAGRGYFPREGVGAADVAAPAEQVGVEDGDAWVTVDARRPRLAKRSCHLRPDVTLEISGDLLKRGVVVGGSVLDEEVGVIGDRLHCGGDFIGGGAVEVQHGEGVAVPDVIGKWLAACNP